MGAFFVYIVKSSACLILFYLFYRLLLSKDTFHRFNRIGLLGLVLLSIVIPFFRITVEEPIVMQPAVLDLETLLMMAPLMGKKATVHTIPFWIQGLLWIYIAGVAFFFCQFAYSCVHTIRMIRRGTVSRLENGICLVVTSEAITPFSWMRYILVSQKDMDESGQEILTHELAHIRLYHSFDLLISEICILLHWFNPAAWLLKQELQNIHEFEADENVLTHGIDAKKYQLLLIKKAVGSQRFTSMANSLNHSSLKKRITMMLKRKSNPWARLKYLCVLPLAALAVVSFARPEIVRELDKISSVKFSEIVPIKEIAAVKNVEKPVVPDSVIVSPSVVLNTEKMMRVDSVLISLGDMSLELGDLKLDYDLQLDQLEHLDLSELSMPDFDFSQFQLADLQLNLDSLATQFNFSSDITLNFDNLKAFNLDTAQMRKIREEYRAAMKLNQEEWRKQQTELREQQAEWRKKNQAELQQLREKMKGQKLTEEQLLVLREEAKRIQQQVAMANINEEKVAEIQKSAEKVMKEQEKVIVKQQIELEKAMALQQKEMKELGPQSNVIPIPPLYVIDGKESTGEELKDLDPARIESISVLKNASAVEEYGEKGKNGVILITTKKK